jgi:CBS domain containing-hemolysin-like protein
MRQPYVVLESKPLDELLTEFRKKGVHFGIVKNDDAVFTGIITLDAVLQNLFGSIAGTACDSPDPQFSKG